MELLITTKEELLEIIRACMIDVLHEQLSAKPQKESRLLYSIRN
jgi:hypothetical protein